MEAIRLYYLQIADNALILSHRLSEYSSKGPFLEEDLANTNVALDLIGLAESVYNEAAACFYVNKTADDLAYKRSEHEYINVLLVEQNNQDFAHIMVRQFFMDVFHYFYFTELTTSADNFLSSIATKSLKEVTYHLKRSSEWIVRLGDGTQEAYNRTVAAIEKLWPFTNELFVASEADTEMLRIGLAPNLEKVKQQWFEKVKEIFFIAKLNIPDVHFKPATGKKGVHTEQMGYILGEMQFLTNKYPEAIW